MRIGLQLIAFPELDGDTPSVRTFAELVRAADQAGIDRLATGDGQSGKLECVAAQALMATVTDHALIGPMVTNSRTRDPGVAASALATIDAISSGRAFFVLGRGAGAVLELGYSLPSVADIREYFGAVRELLAVGHTVYQGRELSLAWPYPLGHIPLYLVAEGPRMLALAGELADGVYIGTGILPEVIKDSVARIHDAAAAAGRDPSTIDCWWEMRFCVRDSHDEAVQAVKVALSSVVDHALRGDYTAKLVPDELREPLRRYHERYSVYSHGTADRSTTNAELLDELGLAEYCYRRFALVGDPAEVVEQLNALSKLGVDQVHLNAWSLREIQLLGEQVLPHLR